MIQPCSKPGIGTWKGDIFGGVIYIYHNSCLSVGFEESIQCVEEVSKSHRIGNISRCLPLSGTVLYSTVQYTHLSCLRRNTYLKNLLCKDLCHRLVVRALDFFSGCLVYSYHVFSSFLSRHSLGGFGVVCKLETSLIKPLAFCCFESPLTDVTKGIYCVVLLTPVA